MTTNDWSTSIIQMTSRIEKSRRNLEEDASFLNRHQMLLERIFGAVYPWKWEGRRTLPRQGTSFRKMLFTFFRLRVAELRRERKELWDLENWRSTATIQTSSQITAHRLCHMERLRMMIRYFYWRGRQRLPWSKEMNPSSIVSTPERQAWAAGALCSRITFRYCWRAVLSVGLVPARWGSTFLAFIVVDVVVKNAFTWRSMVVLGDDMWQVETLDSALCATSEKFWFWSKEVPQRTTSWERERSGFEWSWLLGIERISWAQMEGRR